MECTIISVPDMNDSVSRIVLDGTAYQIRFTYNDTGDFWTFGIYTSQSEPIVIGIKVVPNFPLNLFYGTTNLPSGVFFAKTKLERIGRDDFVNEKAQFIFLPVEDSDEEDE